MQIMLCPRFSLCSALFWISMIQLVIYVTTLTIGGIDKKSFLAVSSATNDTFGQKDPYKMKNNWEFHRFFMPMLLHADLGHISANLIAQLMIGANLEADIGSTKFLALYILSGLGGNAFSALTTDALAVGASTAVFGLSGSYVAFIILNT